MNAKEEKNEEKNEQWLTSSDVSKILGISRPTVVLMISSGKLKYVLTPGGHRRISKNAVEEYIQSFQQNQIQKEATIKQ
ncbi:MAG: helix-turn-helix domain-containing protein [Bacteroidales bacterium]